MINITFLRQVILVIIIIFPWYLFADNQSKNKDETEDKTVRERVVDAGNSVGSFFVRVGDGITEGFNNVRERLSNSEDENQKEEKSNPESLDKDNSALNFATTIIDTTKQQKRS